MKGIVLQIRNKEAVILADDGIIRKVKNHDYSIGEVVIMKEKQKGNSKLLKWSIGIAAAFVLSTTGVYAYYKPTGYVSLDINPSIEYSINMFDRVLKVKAVNEDGNEILTELNLKNMSIDEAIEKTTAKLIEENYITDDEEGNLIITASAISTKNAEKLAKQLKEKIMAYINKEDKEAYIEAEAVGLERVEKARELGVTPGKLNLVEKLIASSQNPDEIDIKEWLNKSPKEINKAIKENRKALKDKTPKNLDEDKLAEDDDDLDTDGSVEEENKLDENELIENGNYEKIIRNIDNDDKAKAIGLERVEKARELGVTPGKLNLVEKLIKSSDNPDDIDIEEWLNKSAKEINEAIKENRKALKNKNKK